LAKRLLTARSSAGRGSLDLHGLTEDRVAIVVAGVGELVVILDKGSSLGSERFP